MNFFSFLGRDATSTELPDIFPIPIESNTFVTIDVQNIYTRILTDTLERTQGIPEIANNLLWDNCLGSEKQDGLVTLIAKAMVGKEDLFLVYLPVLKVIRKADQIETEKIRADYKAKGESSTGVFITFKNYKKTDMIKFYSGLEYCAVGGLWKQGNLAKAIQIKITDLRASVGLSDKAEAEAQGLLVAKGLSNGKDVLIDAKDILETMKPDLTATESMHKLISKKQGFYLGMPATYLEGEQSTGLGDKSAGDAKAVDRGLKNYFFSIIKPVMDGIFSAKVSFKSEDSEGLTAALETLKTMDLTSDEHLSKENKTLIVNKAFGLDENQKGDPVEKVNPQNPQTNPQDPNAKVVPPKEVPPKK